MSRPDGAAGDLQALAQAVAGAAHRTVVLWGAALQRQVQLNASGRPGPNAPTGDYRRSINRHTTRTVGGSRCEVGTNKPQARRLELGFVGTDSLGRSFDQPAYPHFAPALTFVSAGFIHAIERIGIPATATGVASIGGSA